MSGLSGQPVPQSDLPDTLKGTPVPTSDLPQGAGPAAGAGASSVAPGASTPPSAGPSLEEKILGPSGPEDQEFGDLARGVGRGVVEGVAGGFTFVPDLAVKSYNIAQGGIPGWLGIAPRHLPEPGELFQKWFDKTVAPPKSPVSKLAEFGTSMVAGGGTGFGVGKAIGEGEKAASGVEEVGRQVTRQRADMAKEVEAVGGKVSPAYIGGAVTRGLQTMSSQPMTHELASENNEGVADRLVKATIGVKPGEELTESTFKRLKDEAYRAYQAIADNLGHITHDDQYFADIRKAGGRHSAGATDPYGAGQVTSAEAERLKYQNPRESGVTAQEMLDKIRDLRHDARMNMKNYNPESNMLGRTQWDIATAMENQIQRAAERAAASQGSDPTSYSAAPYMADLVPDMKAARQQLARINAVEMSMGAGGHVRAVDLAKMVDRKVPLDGGLAQVAAFANEFPKDWAPISEKGERGAFSAVDYLLGGSGILFHHPMEAGLAFARPIARRTILTKTVQHKMIEKAGKEKSAASTLTKAGAVAGASQDEQ